MDAGFPDEQTLSGLEGEGVLYVARIKGNAVLDAMAEPYLTRPRGRPPAEARTWTCEITFRSGKNLSFAVNEVRLILSVLAYNLVHAVRSVEERAFQAGISIKRLQERYLKVAARFTLHARRISAILFSDVSERWQTLWGNTN